MTITYYVAKMAPMEIKNYKEMGRGTILRFGMIHRDYGNRRYCC